MSIQKPYYRIMRPMVRKQGMVTDNLFQPYLTDNRYASDRSTLCNAYKLIENDLKKLFEFIEPSDDNFHVYSHRTYELLLRAATEVETNFKRILEANGYNNTRNLNIYDYYKINQATKLDGYEIILNIWQPQKKTFKPFDNWKTQSTLFWYTAYNDVKHDRHINFNKASIENLINAIGALLSLLFAQFGIYAFNPYQKVEMCNTDEDELISTGESLFSIKPTSSWQDTERYDFVWEQLKNTADPINKITF